MSKFVQDLEDAKVSLNGALWLQPNQKLEQALRLVKEVISEETSSHPQKKGCHRHPEGRDVSDSRDPVCDDCPD